MRAFLVSAGVMFSIIIGLVGIIVGWAIYFPLPPKLTIQHVLGMVTGGIFFVLLLIGFIMYLETHQ